MKRDGIVEKRWGGEYVFADNELYCGKVVYIHKGGEFSMHFHKAKDKTWLLVEGSCEVRYIDTQDGSNHTALLSEGDIWRSFPLEPHQLIALEDSVLFEVGTPEKTQDHYIITC
jgi:mannose-6-phosphate isomerase-like protein (cupin superfamily)